MKVTKATISQREHGFVLSVTHWLSSLFGFLLPLVLVDTTAVRRLHADIRREYEIAREVIHPEVLPTESRIADFLLVEHNDIPRTAERVALYWKARRQVFEEDRWLLPLDQVGLVLIVWSLVV